MNATLADDSEPTNNEMAILYRRIITGSAFFVA